MNSCPKCGSVRVTVTQTTGQCKNLPTCGYTGKIRLFNGLSGTPKAKDPHKDVRSEYLPGGGTFKRPVRYD